MLYYFTDLQTDSQKGKKSTNIPHTMSQPKEGVIQCRQPMGRLSLQNCFPQVSTSLLRVVEAVAGYPRELTTTTGFELGTLTFVGV